MTHVLIFDSEVTLFSCAEVLTPYRISICLGVVGGVVTVCVIWYGIRFYKQYGAQERRESRLLSQPNQLLLASIPLQRPPFLRNPAATIEEVRDTGESKGQDQAGTLPLFRQNTRNNTRQSTRSPISPEP